ncbi:hypothetical protein ABGB17_22850 [Sphaerisporangium sp. B11E5]|uniref:hypothetical protein n=1 Tax=Sphaerisporangium sp. B11E5 TaxID=3153563 RepID=UPI00325CF921
MSTDEHGRDGGIVYTYYPGQGTWQVQRPDPPAPRRPGPLAGVVVGLVTGVVVTGLFGGVLFDRQLERERSAIRPEPAVTSTPR